MDWLESAKETMEFTVDNLDEKNWISEFEMKLGDSSKELVLVVSQMYCFSPDKPQLKIGLRSVASNGPLFASLALVGDAQILDGDNVERLSLNTKLTTETDIYLDLVPKSGVIWDSHYNKLEVRGVKFSLEIDISVKRSPQ
jgi:hypothetical protein